MSTTITLAASDGHRFEAARADPKGKAKGGVIVLHAIYGVTEHIGRVCDQWADAGYAAVAPALYDRNGKGHVHGYDQAGAAAGRDSYALLSEANILDDIRGCMAGLAGAGPLIVSGFCTGGTWAWVAATKLDGLAAQVNFYGSHVASRVLDLSPRCPTIIHYGDNDHIVPMKDVERIRAAHPAVAMEIYPGAGHAFFNPEQEHHDAAAAARSWQSSLAFLERQLGRSRS